MKPLFLAAAALLIPAVLLSAFTGCEQPTVAESSDFAAGAFPPTLSDTDYHRKSWTRIDCLSCHETGANDSPKVVHGSLPALAMDAKCRTCHVFVEGSKPRQ
jgi:hypothetical protein